METTPGTLEAKTMGEHGGASTRQPERNENGGGAGMKLSYCFSLKATIHQTVVGEIHGGYRVDLAYTPKAPSVLTDDRFASAYPLAKELHARAAITSGNDWAFVSSDAIVDFDSRITLRLDPAGRALIGCRLRGRGDLRKVVPTSQNIKDDPLNAWKKGLPNGAYLPLVLAVTFDVPKVALESDLQRTYDEFRDLSRVMFVGVGKDFFTGTKPGAEADRKDLEIHLFTATPGGGA